MAALTQALDLTGFQFGGSQQVPRVIDATGMPLYPEISVDESHEDELFITEHVVESGTVISDHAFKRPAELRLRVGWSDAGTQGAGVRAVYNSVLALQQARRPFTVQTQKRTYNNMLVQSLRTNTDDSMAFTFLAEINFREVILASTQVISGGIPTDPSRLANPRTALPETNIGNVQTAPVSVTPSQLGSGGGNTQGFG